MTDINDRPKRLSLYLFVAFFVVGVVLGIWAVFQKASLPEGALRFAGLLYFGLFLVAISAAEIWSGEIRMRISGPPACIREEAPVQFWIQVGGRFLFGIFLLAALFWKA